jgi:hypothetical protein
MEDGNHDSITTTRARHFSFLSRLQIGCEVHSASYSMEKKGLKQPGRQTAPLTASADSGMTGDMSPRPHITLCRVTLPSTLYAIN